MVDLTELEYDHDKEERVARRMSSLLRLILLSPVFIVLLMVGFWMAVLNPGLKDSEARFQTSQEIVESTRQLENVSEGEGPVQLISNAARDLQQARSVFTSVGLRGSSVSSQLALFQEDFPSAAQWLQEARPIEELGNQSDVDLRSAVLVAQLRIEELENKISEQSSQCDCADDLGANARRQVRVFFNPKSTELGPIAESDLSEFTESLQTLDPDRLVIHVSGHADSVGDRAVNQRLSDERASTVADYLKSRLPQDSRFVVVGYGEDRSPFPRDDETPEVYNRSTLVTVSL